MSLSDRSKKLYKAELKVAVADITNVEEYQDIVVGTDLHFTAVKYLPDDCRVEFDVEFEKSGWVLTEEMKHLIKEVELKQLGCTVTQ